MTAHRPGEEADPGLVAGRFRVLGLLGSGGSAVVYRAFDIETGTTVALKVAHPHTDAARLPREAGAARRVSHPNVVRVLDAGVLDDGRAWLTLGLVDGASLADVVDRRGPLGPTDALAVADGLLAALAALHEVGLVHRDVSPQNVHVTDGVVRAEGVRLLDLGLTGAAGSAAVDESGGILGNAAYVSPEQASGAGVDPRGDLYQAGAVLYFALTGRPPFGSGPPERLVESHRSAPPPVPSEAMPGLPAEVDQLVVRAMLKDPGLRFGSATAMREAVLLVRGAPTAGPGTRVLPASSPVVAAGAARATASAIEIADGSRPDHAPTTARGAVLAVLVVLAAVVGVAWLAQAGPGPVTEPAPASVDAPEPRPTPSRTEVRAGPPVRTVAVPVLAGLSTAEALTMLDGAGLRAGAVSTVPAPAAAGTVLRTSPTAGERVRAGTAVDLEAATGTTIVPAVVGLRAEDAEAAVRAAGLVPVRQGAGAAAVLAVSVPAGIEVAVGSPLTLDLGEPAPPPTPTTTPTPTSTPTPTTTPSASPSA